MLETLVEVVGGGSKSKRFPYGHVTLFSSPEPLSRCPSRTPVARRKHLTTILP